MRMNANYIMEKLSNPESYKGLDQFMTDARKEIPEVSAALRKRETPPIAFPVTDAPDFAPFRPFDTPAQDALPEFPYEVLPPELCNFAVTMGQSTETAPALAAVPALGAVAIAIGRKFQAYSKAAWNEPMNLYVMNVADSGGLKSTVMKRVKRPLVEYQEEWNDSHAAEFDEWRDKMEVTESEISAKKAAIAKGNATFDDLAALQTRRRSLAENPEKPLRLLAMDCTPEKLGRILQDNNETMALFADEGGFLLSLTGERYSEHASLDCLLNAYTWDSVQTSRVTSDDVDLKRPCLNITCSCQPITAQELTANRVYNRRGLTARFLYSFPPELEDDENADPLTDPPPPNADALDAYDGLIRDLLSIAPEYDERGKITPRTIVFSAGAMKLRRELEVEARRLWNDLDRDDPFRAWLKRYHAHAVRLAGILHVCEYRNKADAVELSEETFYKARRLARYFKAHAEYAFEMSGASMPESERDARYIWKRIQELRRLRESAQVQISKRDLLRQCRRFKKKEEMDAGINELVTHGYIRILPSGGGRGRRSETIESNPEAE